MRGIDTNVKKLVAIASALVLFMAAATSFIDLTTQVKGILPIANGGTGSSTATFALGNGSTATTGTAFSGTTNVATQAYADSDVKPIYSTAQVGLSSITSSNTGITTAITMVTPGADGTYRFIYTVTETAAGSGGTCTAGTVTVNLQYTDADSGVAYTAQQIIVPSFAGAGTSIIQMSLIAVVPGANTFWVGVPREFRAKGGVAVNYRVYQVVASNCTVTPVFTVRPALYYMGY